MRRLFTVLAACSALALALHGHQAAAGTAEPPTAQTLLFDAAYLKPLAAPARITYRYSQKSADVGMFGPSLDDDAVVRLVPSASGNGAKDAVLALFTGSGQREIGPLPNISGNPVIMMFLEHDAAQMVRHVGGSPVYFRNVIRAAFRDGAKIEPVEITWRGVKTQAMKVTIQPFLNVPHAERLQLFRTKIYEFIASDAVPGGIYDMRSAIADTREGKSGHAVDIHLTLTGIDYDKASN